MTLSQKIAEFVSTTDFAYLPDGAVKMSKVCLLDWLGVAIGGASTREGQIAADLARGACPDGPSTILGHSFKSSPVYAALANGIMGHSLELDDFHNEGISHAAVAIMPAALAVAEAAHAQGRTVLSAITLGYEVMIRIGMAVAPAHMLSGFHPTGTCGVFGAAAAAGKIMGLTGEQLANALGIAGVQAAGLLEFGRNKDAMTQNLNPGRAAENGVVSAVLASNGFTGSMEILEGKNGFFHSFLGEKPYDPARLTRSLGKHFEISRISLKPYPCCRAFHSAIDAVLYLSREHAVRLPQISRVFVRTNRVAAEQSTPALYRPANVWSSQMSLPYNIARALANGDVATPEEFRMDENVLRLIDKVEVTLDPQIDCDYPRLLASKVTIELLDGTEYSRRVDYPRGDPENPMTVDEISEKFLRLTRGALPGKLAEAIMNQIEHLEQLDDVAALLHQ
jgi:2-methylcitrate dehydratase PrpD